MRVHITSKNAGLVKPNSNMVKP